MRDKVYQFILSQYHAGDVIDPNAIAAVCGSSMLAMQILFSLAEDGRLVYKRFVPCRFCHADNYVTEQDVFEDFCICRVCGKAVPVARCVAVERFLLLKK